MNLPGALLRRRHRPARYHHRHDGVRAVLGEIGIALELLKTAWHRDSLAVRAHRGEMSGKRLARTRHRFLEGVADRNAGGHVGKAHAIARAFVFVHQGDIAGHVPRSFQRRHARA